MGLGWERQMLSTWLPRRHCHRWYARFEEEEVEEVRVVVIFSVMHEPLCEAPLTLGTCETNVICVIVPRMLCTASACVSARVCTSIKFNFLLSRQNFDVYFCHVCSHHGWHHRSDGRLMDDLNAFDLRQKSWSDGDCLYYFGDFLTLYLVPPASRCQPQPPLP